MLAMPSTPPSPSAPGCWSSRDLCRPDLDSRPRRRNREAQERRLFLGPFLTEGREMEEAVDCRSRSEPITPPPLPPPKCWCFCRLMSPEAGEGGASGEPGLGSLSLTLAGRSGSGTGLGDGVRWWTGEGEGGPGWGGRAPEGPSAFKTWWLLLISLVVTSNSRILAEGWGLTYCKTDMQQNLEEKSQRRQSGTKRRQVATAGNGERKKEEKQDNSQYLTSRTLPEVQNKDTNVESFVIQKHRHSPELKQYFQETRNSRFQWQTAGAIRVNKRQ